MSKRNVLIILVITIILSQTLIFQSSLSVTNKNRDSVSINQSSNQPLNDLFTINAAPGTEILKTNVIENGGFEEESPNGAPYQYGVWGTIDSESNHSYQDEVHSGNYGAYMRAKSTTQYSATFSSSRYFLYIPEYSYLDEDITMNLWYNAKANPDIAIGGEIYIRLRFNTNLGSYYLIYYITRQANLPGNTTNYGYIDVRGSLDSWTNLVRNVTDDFEDVFPAPDLSQSYLRNFYCYINSPVNPTGDVILLFDDVSFQNSTGFEYFYQNGDFETGDSSYWSDNSVGPASVYLTDDDFTEGQNAMNMTTYSPTTNGYSYIYCDRAIYSNWMSVPKGLYAFQPGDLIFKFNWKYSDTPTLGTQRSYMYFYAANSTYEVYYYFLLGDCNDDILSFTNSTYGTYAVRWIAVEGFGNRDIWTPFTLDYYSLMVETGLNDLIPYYFGFEIDNYYVANNVVRLLVDDLQIITHPAGDPSFECNFAYTTSDPILLWETPYNHNFVNITTDAHSGNYAANISSYGGYTYANCLRYTYFPIGPNQYTDFWWKLNKLTDTGNFAYAEINLRTDEYKTIHYILGNNSLIPWANSTDDCYYIVEGNNQLGTWNNIFRNLQVDFYNAFGFETCNVTRIELVSSAQVLEEVSLIVDDLYFVSDVEEPVLNNLVRDPVNPEYGQTVDISVDVTDNILLSTVTCFYKIGAGSWGTIPLTQIGDTFTGTIPAADYGVTVSYYFVAVDFNGLSSGIGSEINPLTYIIGDFTDPVLTVEIPPESQTLNGTILLNITNAYDLGSGLASFDIIINGTSVYDEMIFPTFYAWNTEDYTNGEYPVAFRLEDNAGNIMEMAFVYTIYNPPTGWEVFVAFMIQWGPYIGGGAGALLIIILVLVIVVKRKRRLA